MAKPQKRYICQACGSVATKWAGQCVDCLEWNNMAEDVSAVVTPFTAKHNLQSGGRALSLVGLDEKLPCRRAWQAGLRSLIARLVAGWERGRRLRRGAGTAGVENG